MTPWLTRVFLFFSSYIPFWTIVALLTWANRQGLALCAIGAGAVGAVGLGVLFSSIRAAGSSLLRIDGATRQDGDNIAYIVTYIFPFLTLVVASPLELVAIGLLFVVTMLVYVNSDMLYVNPMLALFGFKTFAVQTDQGTGVMLITRRGTVGRGKTVEAVQISPSTWWEKPVAG